MNTNWHDEEEDPDEGPKLEIIEAADLLVQFPNMREPLVDRLLRRGEVANLNAAPKVGKSWMSHNLALTVATGGDFLGYATTPGKVLLVDLELHKETLSSRIATVAGAMGLNPDDYRGRLHTAPIRGRGVDLYRLANMLLDVPADAYDLLILDAWYRLIPGGVSENDNAAITGLYNVLDSIAARGNCGIVVVHHTSKGGQGDKAVTDAGAGAGSMARAADTHIVIREHSLEGAAVLDAVCRSFPKVASRCIRWTFPLWEAADDLDPADIKKAGGRTNGDAAGASLIRQEREAETAASDVRKLVDAMAVYPDGETLKVLRDAAGLNGANGTRAITTLLGKGYAVPCKVKKGRVEYDGFRFTKNPGTVGGTGWDNSTCPTLSRPGQEGVGQDSKESPCPTPTFQPAVPPSGTGSPVPSLVASSGRVLGFDQFNQQGVAEAK